MEFIPMSILRKILGSLFFVIFILSSNSYAKNNIDIYYSEILKIYNKKAPVLIPTYIPKGFKIENVDIHLQKEKGIGQGDNYKIIYKNSDGKEFSIESANGGFGGAGYIGEINFKSKFGMITMYIDPIETNPNGNQKLANQIFTEWFYYKNQPFMFSTQSSDISVKRLSKEEAIKIISSLSAF